MTRQRAVDLALDLARMPAVAPAMAASALPVDVLEVIRIAAKVPDACQAAALATGQTVPVLVDAARFYLQQILFTPGADCYRVLGIQPGDSRETARVHMRWLLLWLHPDRNDDLSAIYAKRIVEAWREVSTGSCARDFRSKIGEESLSRGNKKFRRLSASVRFPLIKWRFENGSMWIRKKSSPRFRAALRVAAGLVTVFLLLGLAALAAGSNPMLSKLSGPW